MKVDKTEVARILVLFFCQQNGNSRERWIRLSQSMALSLTDEQIDFGIKSVFFNDEKKWTDYKSEGGLGKQLYALRILVSNTINSVHKFPIPDNYEDEVLIAESVVESIITFFKQEQIWPTPIKKWWQFWL